MSKVSMNSKRILGVAAACLMLAGWSVSSQAETTCTIDNWDLPAQGLTNANVGFPVNQSQPTGNRRYFGPCGLRVPFGGADPAWLENRFLQNSDVRLAEESYKVRFFAFFSDLSGSNIPFFEALNDEGSVVRVFTLYYDDVNGIGVDANGDSTIDGFFAVEPGQWQEIELGYSAAGTEFVFRLNGVQSSLVSPAASPNVTFVRIGDLDGIGDGWVDFDHFDSRRSAYPSEDPDPTVNVLVGDATCDPDVDPATCGRVNSDDAVLVIDERMGRGAAPGMADCDRNGRVNSDDFVCIIDIRMGRR